MDIYLLEAIINGILLGGVLALLALGLNLIFGVIDVVWIAYADIVMCGMYLIYYLNVEFGRLAATDYMRGGDRLGGGAGGPGACSDYCAHSRFGADQSAPGYRRASVFSAELRDTSFRNRFPQYRRALANPAAWRRLYQLGALIGICGRWGWRNCAFYFSSEPLSEQPFARSRRTATLSA